MNLEIALVALVAFLCYREWYHSRELAKLEDRYFGERQRLLDRLMARDFTQYKQAEVLEKFPLKAPEPEEEDYDYNAVGY
jgi:hypothetical protein